MSFVRLEGLGVGAVAICLAICGACTLDVNYQGTQYRCHDGVCPRGQSCVAGWCTAEPPGEPDAPPGEPDAPPVVPDASPPDASPPCTAGDRNAEDPGTGHCYMLFTNIASWDTARLACEILPGNTHLVTVTSLDEQNLVYGLAAPAGLIDLWMGGTDAETEGTWRWHNGEPWGYTNWRTGEPNNGGTSGVPEHCLIIESDMTGTWDDRPCDREYPFVCERS